MARLPRDPMMLDLRLERTGPQRYPWRQRCDWTTPTPRPIREALRRSGLERYWFRAPEGGQLLLEVTEATYTMLAGYASNGCSGWLQGRRRPACHRHDGSRQAVQQDCRCPWSREDSDAMLLLDLRACEVSRWERRAMVRAVSGCPGRLYSRALGQRSPVCPEDCGRCASAIGPN